MRIRNLQDAEAKLGKRGRTLVERAMGKQLYDKIEQLPKPNKYRNQPVEVDGQRFDSKLEEAVYRRLVAQYGRGGVIRQVSIPIGSKRIRPDFLCIVARHEDGTFTGRWLDAKGHATEAWSAKQNHLLDVYGLEIQVVKK